MKTFTIEPLSVIVESLQDSLLTTNTVTIEVVNPDIARGSYAGELITIADQPYLYRGYKAWHDLAQLLFCRLLTPSLVKPHLIQLTFEALDMNVSFHNSNAKEEKYGTQSLFARIHKNEEPSFLSVYLRALQSVKLGKRKRILNLGVNTGDEFDLIRQILQYDVYKELELVGIDFSASAIEFAQKRFNDGNTIFYVHDINDLSSLDLGVFDLIISIGTLQSPGIDEKRLLMSLVQTYLSSDSAVILGFPNCRWMDGEIVYGAKAPNYPYSELSLVIKDIHWCKKYLQQKKFRVTVTGKEYLFLTATSINH